MEKLLFATHNTHKLQEVRQMLEGLCNVISPLDLEISDVPEETETTLAGNALLKARALYRLVGIPSFADDTGLLVDALDGAPGVFSARYAGPESNEADNRSLLLTQLKEFPTPRKAHFSTVVAYIDDRGQEWIFEGEVHGQILNQEVGTGGFGYDALFVPDGYEETFAQMSPQKKNELSHRRRAIEKLRVHLLYSIK